jgi:hypothetical protein
MDLKLILIGLALVVILVILLRRGSSFSATPDHLAPGIDPSKLESGAFLPSGGKDCSQYGSGWVEFTPTLCKKS